MTEERHCTLSPSSRQLTQQFLSQRGELLDGQASLGGGGELPAEDLGHLVPRGHRGLGEEVHVLHSHHTQRCVKEEEQGEGAGDRCSVLDPADGANLPWGGW